MFWYDVAVLAALRRLRDLGLDQGSLSKEDAAAVAGGGPGNAQLGRLLEEKLKKAGWASQKIAANNNAGSTSDDSADHDPLKLKKFIQQFKT